MDRSRKFILHLPASSRGGSIPVIRDVAKKTDSTKYALPALRFQTCRPLPGNVRNRELTIIQRRILRRLRNNQRSIKRKIYPRENLNSYIQSQTTRKLPLFHGDLPITEMHRRTERTSYIPFPLNPETRSDVIPVRLHFSDTIPKARQPISHRRVCVNNGMVSITHLKVSHGDLISFQENDARTRGEEIRRSFYIDISVEKIIGKFLDHPFEIGNIVFSLLLAGSERRRASRAQETGKPVIEQSTRSRRLLA
ncbi:hypothetical protein Syun_031916 [Stephania yunnanensis]|uniref:RNA-binding S4 domain-containing protein n=1 Tax=Stephania yunnanensis TaxID=152371 RepID=A0AAP0HF32_9MAGN